ncbi:hypothetical protein KC19_7G069800, partial [Ceratodon purpureus]
PALRRRSCCCGVAVRLRDRSKRRHSQTASQPAIMAAAFTPLLAPPAFRPAPLRLAFSSARASLQQAPATSVAAASLADAPVCVTGGTGGAVSLESEPLLGTGRDEGGSQEGGEQSWSRRGVMGAAALAMVASFGSLSCEPAQAFEFSLGISGPKEWLRGQKRKTAQFLLNPIEASRNRLSSAVLLLSSAEGSSFENYEEAGRLVKVAARDCTPSEAGSILDFQTRTGVEVCTFKLVLKNASSLLPDDDPVKLNAVAALDDLIRSFIAVDTLLTSGGASAATQRDDVMGALKQTMVALDTFQQGVQNCLD